MKNLIILGGTGIGMIAASIAEITGYKVLGFLNDNVPAGDYIGKYKKFPVLGKTKDVDRYLDKTDTYFFIAYVGLQNEKEHYLKVQKLNIPIAKLASLVHPTAIIPDGYCKIGAGVLFGPHAQLSPDTTISDSCILLGQSFVGHDSFLDHFAHVATNGVIGANVYVGKGVHIGSNSVTKEKIKIGDYALIGSGAVVTKDVEENTIVAGNPAKILKVKK